MSQLTIDLYQPKGNTLPAFLFTPSSTSLRRPQIAIRPMQLADIHPLHTTCYPDQAYHHFVENCRRSLVSHARGRCHPLVATIHRRIVGRGQLYFYPNVAEIADLIVAPAWRGQGIGTALIEVLTNIAAYAHQPRLEIGVNADNLRALTLYQRLGFTVDREIRLPTTGETGIILERPLAPVSLRTYDALDEGDAPANHS